MTDDIDRSHHDHEHSPPGPHTLPPPPIPKDAKLPPGFDWFPLYYRTLIQSDFWQSNQEEPEIIVAAIALWMAAMQQNPVGSLPTYRPSLMSLSGTYAITQRLQPINRYIEYLTDNGIGGESVKTLSDTLSAALPDAERTLDGALWGFEEHSDGRLYHPTITKVVLDQLKKSDKHRTGANLTNQKKQEEQEDEPMKRSAHTKRGAKRNAKRGAERGDIDTDKDKEKESSSRASAPDHDDSPSLRSEERKQAPPSAEERGSARTEFVDRPTSPPKASPSGQAEPQTSNAGFIKEFGMTPKAMAEAMWQATTGSTRMGRDLEGLENIEPTITLIRSNPGLSFRDDVLSAITMASLRAGGIITSWRYFRDAILERYQNRIKGAGNGAGPQGYEAGNPPNWWQYSEEKKRGEPPPGHPWQKRVFDGGKLRKYGDPPHWDWQWYDRVKKYTDTGGYPNGEWDESFAKERPGRPSSSCPDDICAEFGIVPQARREGAPIIDMRVVREVQARRAEEARRGVFPMPPAPEDGTLAKAMGGLATGVAGQLAPEDDAPPF